MSATNTTTGLSNVEYERQKIMRRKVAVTAFFDKHLEFITLDTLKCKAPLLCKRENLSIEYVNQAFETLYEWGDCKKKRHKTWGEALKIFRLVRGNIRGLSSTKLERRQGRVVDIYNRVKDNVNPNAIIDDRDKKLIDDTVKEMYYLNDDNLRTVWIYHRIHDDEFILTHYDRIERQAKLGKGYLLKFMLDTNGHMVRYCKTYDKINWC